MNPNFCELTFMQPLSSETLALQALAFWNSSFYPQLQILFQAIGSCSFLIPMHQVRNYPMSWNEKAIQRIQMRGSPPCVFLFLCEIDPSRVDCPIALRWRQMGFFFPQLFLVGMLVCYIITRSLCLWIIVFLLFLWWNLYNESLQMLLLIY